eukprot:959958-Prymnesium_polylepis.2
MRRRRSVYRPRTSENDPLPRDSTVVYHRNLLFSDSPMFDLGALEECGVATLFLPTTRAIRSWPGRGGR